MRLEHGLCACMVDNPLSKARSGIIFPYRRTNHALSLTSEQKTKTYIQFRIFPFSKRTTGYESCKDDVNHLPCQPTYPAMDTKII